MSGEASRPSLQLLGGVGLSGVGPKAADRLLGQAKVVGVLAYLALAPRGRYQRRDRLATLLWPDASQSQARAALRKAVMAVRRALGAGVISVRGDEEVQLNAEALQCDVAEFLRFAGEGKLGRALESYEGELMPGFHLPGCPEFIAWLDGERARVAEEASAAAWAVALQHETKGEGTLAGRRARLVVRWNWSEERVLRQVMRLLVRIGDRAGAVRAFEDCARRMRAELETDPSPETLALAAEIRSQQ